MTDDEVAALLRSKERLVVVDAPAGCGKTHQAAFYAKDAASTLTTGRVLILTHTHAARSVFAERTRNISRRVEIRTIDGFLTELAAAYHRVLGLPSDVATWARDTDNGFEIIAEKCSRLLQRAFVIATALKERYPIIICDEHQDSSEAQHAAIMALADAGSTLRIFGDPMQIIFAPGSDVDNWRKREQAIQKALERWEILRATGVSAALSTPHRWATGSPALGTWVLRAREALRDSAGTIDLRGPKPDGLTVLFADNSAPPAHRSFRLTAEQRKPIDQHIGKSDQILILAHGNDMIDQINGFLNRRIRIWEGHTRHQLSRLVQCVRANTGQAGAICEGLLIFIESVTVGFTRTAHGNRLHDEVATGCKNPARGKPAHLQVMARHVLQSPDHRGVAAALSYLMLLIEKKDSGFTDIKIDMKSELREAILIGSFDNPDQGITEISRRRAFSHPRPPSRCLSTIHKSKGLECDNAIIIPCDASSFSGTMYKRRLLYVGLSRAKKSLTLVVSRNNPGPLFLI